MRKRNRTGRSILFDVIAPIVMVIGVIGLATMPKKENAKAAFSGRPIRDAPVQVIGNAGAYVACNAVLWSGWQTSYFAGKMHVKFDFDDSNSDATTTAITMRCETYSDTTPANDAGRDLPGTDGGVFAGGALTISSGIATWSNALGVGAPNSERWTWTVPNLPDNYLNCAITCTGGDATDLIRVYFSGESP